MEALDQWVESHPLRQWRRARRLSMRKAALVLNTSYSNIANWEQGQYMPYPVTLRAMSEATGEPTLHQAWLDWWEARPTT